jgi:hypothetical protein
VHVGETLVPQLAKGMPEAAGIVTSGRRLLEWHKRRLRGEEKRIQEDLRLLKEAKPFWRA